MQCNVCSRKCELAPGDFGYCCVYFNDAGKLVNRFQNKISTLAIEPIEKRPFFHFCAGTKFLSIGTMGCQLSCDFCQNSRVSQELVANCKDLTPQMIVSLAELKGANGIAFTYNEPTIHPEYILEVAKQSPLPVAVKTNGYSTAEWMSRLCEHVDAWNVDIKGNDATYLRMEAKVWRIWRNMTRILAAGRHLEVSYLVTPEMVDRWDFHKLLSTAINKFEKFYHRPVPIHLLYCYPVYRQTESYPPERLLEIAAIFQKRVQHVYISNHHGTPFVKFRNTVCPQCHEVLVERGKEVVVKKQECCGIPLYNTCAKGEGYAH